MDTILIEVLSKYFSELEDTDLTKFTMKLSHEPITKGSDKFNYTMWSLTHGFQCSERLHLGETMEQEIDKWVRSHGWDSESDFDFDYFFRLRDKASFYQKHDVVLQTRKGGGFFFDRITFSNPISEDFRRLINDSLLVSNNLLDSILVYFIREISKSDHIYITSRSNNNCTEFATRNGFVFKTNKYFL